MISLSIWQGKSAETAELMTALEGGPLPISATVVAYLWRGGEEEKARGLLREPPVRPRHRRLVLAARTGAYAAEVAPDLGDADLGARAYAKLAPYAGMSCVAGSGNASGPVDAFLAMAAAAAGGGPGRHPARGRRRAAVRGVAVPLAGQWLRGQRERFGF